MQIGAHGEIACTVLRIEWTPHRYRFLKFFGYLSDGTTNFGQRLKLNVIESVHPRSQHLVLNLRDARCQHSRPKIIYTVWLCCLIIDVLVRFQAGEPRIRPIIVLPQLVIPNLSWNLITVIKDRLLKDSLLIHLLHMRVSLIDNTFPFTHLVEEAQRLPWIIDLG